MDFASIVSHNLTIDPLNGAIIYAIWRLIERINSFDVRIARLESTLMLRKER